MTPAQAVWRGHRRASLPALSAILVAALLGWVVTGKVAGVLLGVLIGALPAWLWWAIAMPRWRDWLDDQRIPESDVYDLAVRTGLAFPRGLILEGTEGRRRDGTRGWRRSERADVVALLRTLEPVLNDGVCAYCSLPPGAGLPAVDAIGVFRESEGTTIIAPEAQVLAAGLPVLFRAAWITLTVHSALDAVGLTAAFSRALADAGISCNVVAAAHHDHIFVPVERAQDAMTCLRALQRDSGR